MSVGPSRPPWDLRDLRVLRVLRGVPILRALRALRGVSILRVLRGSGLALIVAAASTAACGKEGPPLPPLVRIPAAPTELAAERRGDRVDIHLVVPSANADGSRPADLARVDVYGIADAGDVSDDRIRERGTLVGSVDVKAPPDPDEADAGEPGEPAGGVDQGARATVRETLTAGMLEPFDPGGSVEPGDRPVAPLTGPPLVVPSRVYAGVGVSPRGRRGPFSTRVRASLAPAPDALPALETSYDEEAITVAWSGSRSLQPVQEPASGDILPGRFVGLPVPTTGYHVYEVTGPSETRLTGEPIEGSTYKDERLTWEAERCYRVRVVHRYGQAALESEGSPVACVTPVDTFPPRPPTSVQVVPSEGAISLIWQRGTESDLAGFVVLRAALPSDDLSPVTASPIQEANFLDKVAAGVRYVYAVQAVDAAGNRSEPSARSDAVEAR